MKKKVYKYAKEILLFLLLLFVSTNALSYYKSLTLNKESLPLKSLTLLDKSQYLINHKEVTIIHFWATWCPVCKVESSNIEAVSKYFNVLSIAVKSKSKQEIRDYMQENDLSFATHDDESGVIASKFHIQAYPTTFIYNKQGKLIFTDVGYTSFLGLYIKSFLASYL